MSTPDRDQLANALMMARGSMIVCQDMTPPLSDYRAADMILEMFAPALRSARSEALAGVNALLSEYEKDDREHLRDFGQHHPYAGWAADHLRSAIEGKQ